MNTMLLVFAHPDDESFSAGLTIAAYSKADWNIHLLCATLGQKGESGPFIGVKGAELGVIRKKELEEAAKILGIHEVTFLDYMDGSLKEAETGEIEDAIYKKMVELSPNVVITYDTLGISNHPDHIKMCYSTTYAFQKYAKEVEDTRQFIVDVNEGKKELKKRYFASRHKYALRQKSFANVVESDVEPKLYYACMPESVATYLRKIKTIPEESFGKQWIGQPDKGVTTVISGEKQKLTKLKALAKHKTQINDVDRFYGDETNPLIAKEYFILRMQGSTEVYMGKNDVVSDRL